MKLSFSLLISLMFFSFYSVAQQATIKNDVAYNLESIFIGGQKNTIAKEVVKNISQMLTFLIAINNIYSECI